MTTPDILEGLCYCGIEFSRCPVDLRERWTRSMQTDADYQRAAQMLAASLGLGSECVIISTCNRFDIVIHGQLDRTKIKRFFFDLINETDAPARTGDQDADLFRYFTGAQALRTLLRVACSLESLVVGEPHILGQVKDAFFRSQRLNISGKNLGIFFRHCFMFAKRVRTETPLGKNALSIGHAAVDMVRRVFSDLNERQVLILGAGEMARLSAQYIIECQGKLTIANRNSSKAQALSQELSRRVDDAVPRIISLDDALATLHEFDVVIAATGAQQHLIQGSHARSLAERRGGVPLVFVDVGVPRNIDPTLKNFDNLLLFDIDDLAKVMDHNLQTRQGAVATATAMIDADLQDFFQQKNLRQSLKSVGQLHHWFFKAIETELQQEPHLPPDTRALRAQIIAASLAKKFVSHLAEEIRMHPDKVDTHQLDHFVNLMVKTELP